MSGILAEQRCDTPSGLVLVPIITKPVMMFLFSSMATFKKCLCIAEA